jgi:putative thioredoxin
MQTKTHVIDVDEKTFQREVIDRSAVAPVVVDFWAPWCGPCRTLGPILEKLAREGNGAFRLAKVNVDQNQGLAMRFDVQGIPAVKAFRDGKVAAEFVGAQPEPMVRKFIGRLTPTPADQMGEQANDLLANHRWADAEAAYRRALKADPGQAAPGLGLAKALLAQGKGQEAETLLANMTGAAEAATAEKLRPLAGLLAAPRENGQETTATVVDGLFDAAVRLLRRGELEAGMHALLEVIRRDKRFRQDAPRKALLALFEILGDNDPLTRAYRARLATVLF